MAVLNCTRLKFQLSAIPGRSADLLRPTQASLLKEQFVARVRLRSEAQSWRVGQCSLGKRQNDPGDQAMLSTSCDSFAFDGIDGENGHKSCLSQEWRTEFPVEARPTF